MIHMLNERLAGGLQSLGRSLPSWVRPAIAIALLLSALLRSRLGIIDLIALGYGALTWVFIVVMAIPLLTFGSWKVFGPQKHRGRP